MNKLLTIIIVLAFEVTFSQQNSPSGQPIPIIDHVTSQKPGHFADRTSFQQIPAVKTEPLDS